MGYGFRVISYKVTFKGKNLARSRVQPINTRKSFVQCWVAGSG